jgi:hypothetical protein
MRAVHSAFSAFALLAMGEIGAEGIAPLGAFFPPYSAGGAPRNTVAGVIAKIILKLSDINIKLKRRRSHIGAKKYNLYFIAARNNGTGQNWDNLSIPAVSVTRPPCLHARPA